MLLATDETALPETIISRARRVSLGPLPAGLVREQLLERGVEGERAALIARLSEGRIGWRCPTQLTRLYLRSGPPAGALGVVDLPTERGAHGSSSHTRIALLRQAATTFTLISISGSAGCET